MWKTQKQIDKIKNEYDVHIRDWTEKPGYVVCYKGRGFYVDMPSTDGKITLYEDIKAILEEIDKK